MKIRRSVTVELNIAFASMLAFGQAPASFQTVSLKPNKTGAVRPVQLKPDGVTGTNVTLRELLRIAYELHDPQILGPNWIGAEGYDVEAKPAATTKVADLRLMLQTLLTDRFKLKSHRENRLMPVYWLVVADGGPRLRDPKEEETFKAAMAGKEPFRPGFAGMYTNKDLPEFAERLSRGIGRTIIDKTRIKGRYWFELEWPTDHEQPGIASPSLLTAIREQLGLKLENHTAPSEVLVIDHIEKPPTK